MGRGDSNRVAEKLKKKIMEERKEHRFEKHQYVWGKDKMEVIKMREEIIKEIEK